MVSRFSDADFASMSVNDIAQATAESWEQHDLDTFLSLFTDDGVILHPLFGNEPLPAKVVAETLNMRDRGITTVRNVVDLGPTDVGQSVDMYFNETGIEGAVAGDTGEIEPPRLAVMKVTVSLEGKKFRKMVVHGYSQAEKA